MTEAQIEEVEELLAFAYMRCFSTLVHGDAVGADRQAHEIAIASDLDVHIWPASGRAQRAYCEGATFIADPMPPLERNRLIVQNSSILIAAPAQDREVLRSGTWATIRYARQAGKRVIIVWPNGHSTAEGGE